MYAVNDIENYSTFIFKAYPNHIVLASTLLYILDAPHYCSLFTANTSRYVRSSFP